MKKILTEHITRDNIPVITLVLLGSVFIGYSIHHYIETTTELRDVKVELSLTQGELERRLVLLEGGLVRIETDSKSLSETVAAERQRTGSVVSRLGEITNTVGTLEKLTQTDKELLKKYSKNYFLNEHYVPVSLSLIPQAYLAEGDEGLEVHSGILPHLTRMFDEAKNQGVDIRVTSAFRSFGEQAVLKSSYRILYGAGTANQFSAEQGYSEHQLGTTLDIVTPENGNTLSGFDKTKGYAWLLDNAHRFGFILSYPKDNEYYEYEPWHWRFVGVELSQHLKSQGIQFYAADQREVDSYLGKIFD